jgi:hypothetical protein
MSYQMRHFGTSGEIAVLVEEVNEWLRGEDGKLEVVAVSESQGGRLGDSADPFYYCINVTYKTL